MSPADSLVAQTMDRLLADSCTPEALERAESEGWCAPVWDRLMAADFTHISLPEASGGSGGSLGDAADVLKALGRFAASVPFAETALLGGWLLATAGFEHSRRADHGRSGASWVYGRTGSRAAAEWHGRPAPAPSRQSWTRPMAMARSSR